MWIVIVYLFETMNDWIMFVIKTHIFSEDNLWKKIPCIYHEIFGWKCMLRIYGLKRKNTYILLFKAGIQRSYDWYDYLEYNISRNQAYLAIGYSIIPES